MITLDEFEKKSVKKKIEYIEDRSKSYGVKYVVHSKGNKRASRTKLFSEVRTQLFFPESEIIVSSEELALSFDSDCAPVGFDRIVFIRLKHYMDNKNIEKKNAVLSECSSCRGQNKSIQYRVQFGKILCHDCWKRFRRDDIYSQEEERFGEAIELLKQEASLEELTKWYFTTKPMITVKPDKKGMYRLYKKTDKPKDFTARTLDTIKELIRPILLEKFHKMSTRWTQVCYHYDWKSFLDSYSISERTYQRLIKEEGKYEDIKNIQNG